MNWKLIIGPIGGFCGFLIGLCTMNGIFVRPNAQGQKTFILCNLIQYLKLPFSTDKFQIAWATLPNISLLTRLKLLNLNWVVMVGFGTLCSIFNKIILKL